MPSSLASALLVYGAILTSVSDTAGVIVAGLGLGIELVRFYLDGQPDEDGLG